MRRKPHLASLALLALSVLVATPASAQRGGVAPLGDFIKEVAYLWGGNDSRGLAELMAGVDQVLLDTGDGMEAVEPRHAAAALRDLFSDRRSLSVRAVRVTVAAGEEDRSAVVTVADTGVGISAEALPRIFERFYRVDSARSRATGGTGLGLAIVRHVAEGHEGSVTVESELGVGSTFRLRLPLLV